MSTNNVVKIVDKLLIAIYIAVSNMKGVNKMTKAQKELKTEIEKINDERVIEKVRIFILGILAQKGIEEQAKK